MCLFISRIGWILIVRTFKSVHIIVVSTFQGVHTVGFHWAVVYGDYFVSIAEKCCAYCLEGCIGSVVCAI